MKLKCCKTELTCNLNEAKWNPNGTTTGPQTRDYTLKASDPKQDGGPNAGGPHAPATDFGSGEPPTRRGPNAGGPNTGGPHAPATDFGSGGPPTRRGPNAEGPNAGRPHAPTTDFGSGEPPTRSL